MSVMDHMNRAELMQVQSAARIYQERADTSLMPWDQRAPAPVLGEPIEKYRRDLCIKLKRLLPEAHELRRVQYKHLDDATLDIFEPQLHRAVHDAANDPSTVPLGQFRKVIEVDQGGTRSVKWVGQESFVKEFTRPGRRVASFRTDQGFVSASGLALR